MKNIGNIQLDNNKLAKDVCDYLNINTQSSSIENIEEFIKEMTVKKLCEVVGLTGKYNHQSSFFNFFSKIMGEAVCEILNIKIRIAGDSLRLIKYGGINLVEQTISFLKNENLEEAFLDTFEMVDKFKFLIDKINF